MEYYSKKNFCLCYFCIHGPIFLQGSLPYENIICNNSPFNISTKYFYRDGSPTLVTLGNPHAGLKGKLFVRN